MRKDLIKIKKNLILKKVINEVILDNDRIEVFNIEGSKLQIMLCHNDTELVEKKVNILLGTYVPSATVPNGYLHLIEHLTCMNSYMKFKGHTAKLNAHVNCNSMLNIESQIDIISSDKVGIHTTKERINKAYTESSNYFKSFIKEFYSNDKSNQITQERINNEKSVIISEAEGPYYKVPYGGLSFYHDLIMSELLERYNKNKESKDIGLNILPDQSLSTLGTSMEITNFNLETLLKLKSLLFRRENTMLVIYISGDDKFVDNQFNIFLNKFYSTIKLISKIIDSHPLDIIKMNDMINDKGKDIKEFINDHISIEDLKKTVPSRKIIIDLKTKYPKSEPTSNKEVLNSLINVRINTSTIRGENKKAFRRVYDTISGSSSMITDDIIRGMIISNIIFNSAITVRSRFNGFYSPAKLPIELSSIESLRSSSLLKVIDNNILFPLVAEKYSENYSELVDFMTDKNGYKELLLKEFDKIINDKETFNEFKENVYLNNVFSIRGARIDLNTIRRNMFLTNIGYFNIQEGTGMKSDLVNIISDYKSHLSLQLHNNSNNAFVKNKDDEMFMEQLLKSKKLIENVLSIDLISFEIN